MGGAKKKSPAQAEKAQQAEAAKKEGASKKRGVLPILSAGADSGAAAPWAASGGLRTSFINADGKSSAASSASKFSEASKTSLH